MIDTKFKFNEVKEYFNKIEAIKSATDNYIYESKTKALFEINQIRHKLIKYYSENDRSLEDIINYPSIINEIRIEIKNDISKNFNILNYLYKEINFKNDIKQLNYLYNYYENTVKFKENIQSVDEVINSFLSLKYRIMKTDEKNTIDNKLEKLLIHKNDNDLIIFINNYKNISSDISYDKMYQDYNDNKNVYEDYLLKELEAKIKYIDLEEFQEKELKLQRSISNIDMTSEILELFDNFMEESNNLINNLLDENKKFVYEDIPVEYINTYIYEKENKIDTNYIEKYNIYNLNDLLEFSIPKMLKFGLIKNERPFNEALVEINKDYKDKLYINFDPHNISELELEVLKRIYLIFNNDTLYSRIKKLKKDNEIFNLINEFNKIIDVDYISVQKNIDSYESKNNFFITIENTYSYFRKLDYPLNDLLIELEEIVYPKEKEVLYDFKINSASYYAILENDFKVNTSDFNESIKYLPNEVLKNIKSLDIDNSHIKGRLRSWQEFGQKFILVQKKVLIGDEMGLGKTLTALSYMVHLNKVYGKKRFLIICPSSIMENWRREIIKFSDLEPIILHGVNRNSMLNNWSKNGGIAITTFGTLAKLGIEDDTLIDGLTIDEAHYIKNAETKRSKASYKLVNQSEYVVFLTGTPIENRQEEMTNLINVLNHEIGEKLRESNIDRNSKLYKKIIAPVYLRRRVKDVNMELPEKTIIEDYTEFGRTGERLYRDAIMSGNPMAARRASWKGNRIEDIPKLERLQEILKEAKENGKKVLIFTFFRDVIKQIVTKLDEYIYDYIHGEVDIKSRQGIIDGFKKSKDKVGLVAQINTVGHGLNIQFANIIVICEPQIKPSIENQAIARSHRMGQTNKVFVYKLLTSNSIDEKMLEALKEKQKIFDDYADKSEMFNMDNISIDKELERKIIEEERKRLNLFVNKKE